MYIRIAFIYDYTKVIARAADRSLCAAANFEDRSARTATRRDVVMDAVNTDREGLSAVFQLQGML